MVSLWERVHLHSEKEISSFGSLSREGGKETGDRLGALGFREEMETVAGPGEVKRKRRKGACAGAAHHLQGKQRHWGRTPIARVKNSCSVTKPAGQVTSPF